MNITIKKDILLLVEGKDEVEFFEAFLKTIKAHNIIQSIELGGKDNFKNEFPALLLSPNFSDVKRYGIVRDADNSATNTFQSVTNLLNRYNQPVPTIQGEIKFLNGIAAGIFIMPGNSEEGMLEDLCLSTVINHPVSSCVDEYISCLHNNLNFEKENISKEQRKYCFPKNKAKAKMHAFLAGMNKFVPSLGIAAKKGYFDLHSKQLNNIKIFLQKLIR